MGLPKIEMKIGKVLSCVNLEAGDLLDAIQKNVTANNNFLFDGNSKNLLLVSIKILVALNCCRMLNVSMPLASSRARRGFAREQLLIIVYAYGSKITPGIKPGLINSERQ